MPRALAAQEPAFVLQGLEHVTVADFGAHELHPALAQGQLHGHVGHERTDHTRHLGTAVQAVRGHDVEQLIAVEQTAFGVDDLQAVGVAVERNAHVCTMFGHGLDQGLGVGGAHAFVDVQTVGSATDFDDLSAQLVEHGRGNLVGRAVGTVDHDLQAFERELGGEGAFAELDVTARSVVQAA